MQYSKLGNTGLIVSRLSFGAMTFGKGAGLFASVSKVEEDAAQTMIGKALDAGVHHDFNKSISGFHKALSFDDSDPEIWYNLGGAYYSVGKFDSAKIAWLQTLQLKPNHQQAQQGLRALPPHS